MKKVLQALFALSILFPIGFLVLLSFGKNWAYPQVLPESFSATSWSTLFTSDSSLCSSFIMSVGISVSVGMAVTLLSFVTSRYVAYSKFRGQFMLLAYLPYVIAPVILAATLQYFFILLDLSATVTGVLLAQFFIAYPFGVIILNNFWNQKMQAIEELSATLGSSKRQTWIKVLLPISKSALLLCFFQTFLISWFEYGLTSLIGVGAVKTLTIRVFGFVNEANIFYAALASCLLILPPMLLIWFNKRYIFSTDTVI